MIYTNVAGGYEEKALLFVTEKARQQGQSLNIINLSWNKTPS